MPDLRIVRAGKPSPGLSGHDYLAGGGASIYVIQGWVNAAQALGWKTLIWDGRDPERTFDEFEPHIYMGDVRFRHKVPRRIKTGETKVVMTVDQWADPWAFPVLARAGYRTTKRHVQWVRRLDPCFLYHHTSPKGIDEGWAKWRTREQRSVVSIPLAGDTELFSDEGTDPRFDYDIGYLGAYTRYKAPGLREYLLEFAAEFRTAIYGPGWPDKWSADEFLTDADRNKFFRSVRVSPCIHEPHARLYGREITERIYKVPLAGGFTIADSVAAIHDEGFFEPDEVPLARSGSEMREMIRHFLSHPDERQLYAERARRRVLAQHTYFHRLATIVSLLGFDRHLSQLREFMSNRGLGASTQALHHS